MTPDQFQNWLDTMKSMGRFRFDNDAALALNTRPQTIVEWKKNGCSFIVGLACAALYHNIKPWQNSN